MGFPALCKNPNGKFLSSRLALTFSPCFAAQGQNSLRRYNINTTVKKRAVVQDTDALCTLRKTAHCVSNEVKREMSHFQKKPRNYSDTRRYLLHSLCSLWNSLHFEISYSRKINTFFLNLFGEMQVQDTVQFLLVL